ncbi:hypothetical protein FOC34_21940 [Burkholderia multivorans]|uniref:hypothetical protein n=1 Tax=Burkholderia multivorans TaxID=87883 RepID=UPI0012DEAA14|nr:hypothetical protein [Burkholderia multivorans]QGR87839.1 hypothetical protein FOC34_21940 [Burkholderia multivorans]
MSKRFCNKLEKKPLYTHLRGFLPMFCAIESCQRVRERRFRASRACFRRQLNRRGAEADVQRTAARCAFTALLRRFRVFRALRRARRDD